MWIGVLKLAEIGTVVLLGQGPFRLAVAKTSPSWSKSRWNTPLRAKG